MNLQSDFDVRREFPLDQFQLDVREFNKMVGGKRYRLIGLFYRSRKFKGISGRTLLDSGFSKRKDSPDWRPVLDRKGRHISKMIY